MTQKQEQEIILLVVKIFQNVGIKRYIDKIDILKNYQIYFEICKVIFPQSMIQLLRFSQSRKSNSQKIQGVIDIVGKILQNDLYHISGEAIAEGKLSHIRNFLHILELLSQNVHKGNRDQEQVQSAPQNTRSISDYDQQGHYTVIGIDKEFQREYDEEEGNHPHQNEIQSDDHREKKGSYPQRNTKEKQNQQQQQQTENEDSQSERPMNPIMDKKQQSSRNNFVKSKSKSHKPIQKTNFNASKQQAFKRSQKKYRKKQIIDIPKLQQFMKRKEVKEQTRKRFKSNFVRKINNIIEDFETKRLTDLKLQYNGWVKQHQQKTSEKENQIQEESRQRMQFANQLMGERKKKINTLRNAKQAVNTMANLFKQQRNIWRGMRKAKQESQLQQIEAIILDDLKDQELLREALMTANSENFVRRKK